jgi:GNAT superfamily N-acetyltransferase
LKNLATGEFSDEEFAIGKAHIYSSKYVEALSAAVGRRQFFGTWIGEALVGTVGWSTMDDTSSVARIRSIFVSPLYTRMGLAGHLLAHVEREAVTAGFRTYSVRSMTNATGFFVRQGYVVTSHGVRSLLPNRTVPVTFLRKSLA